MKLKVAIIGSGAAGATAALYFHQSGHQVTIFEREEKPTPVGAGIMLQPTGLKILKNLGLEKKALELGCIIKGLHGENHRNKTILDFKFQNKKKLTGLGISRGALFFILFDELIRQEIDIKLGAEIIAIDNKKNILTDKNNNLYKGYNLIIVANGARSALRKDNTNISLNKTQKYGALWAKLPYDNSVFHHKIYQKYEGSHTMIGFMPMGRLDEQSPETVNFFWSIKMRDVEKWETEDLEEWKDKVKRFCPEYAEVIDVIKSKDQVTIAPYTDVVLSPSYQNNIVFIGDSAHPMSPQLAQGASFAMLDAKILFENISQHPTNIDLALKNYHQQRSKQVYFYQKLSRWVTPIFQSDTCNTSLRDKLFPIFSKLPFIKTLITTIVLGYRESYFKNIDKKYY